MRMKPTGGAARRLSKLLQNAHRTPKEAPYLLGTPGRFALAELRSIGFRVHVRYFRGGPAGRVTAEGPLNVPVGNRPVYLAIST